MKGDPLSLIQHSIDPCFNKARSNLNYEQNHFLKQAQHNAERCQCFHAMSNDLTQISQFFLSLSHFTEERRQEIRENSPFTRKSSNSS